MKAYRPSWEADLLSSNSVLHSTEEEKLWGGESSSSSVHVSSFFSLPWAVFPTLYHKKKVYGVMVFSALFIFDFLKARQGG